MGTILGVSVPRPLRRDSNPMVGKKEFDLQNQAVASINSPSMEIKHLLSWTWVQYTSNQQTSIAILIKGKLKFKKISSLWGTLRLNQLTSNHTLDTSI
jgi:hypothetical protein